MKPDWKDAPEWANWLAMDENGTWGWYEKKPTIAGHVWSDENGKYLMLEHSEDWRTTREEKPK